MAHSWRQLTAENELESSLSDCSTAHDVHNKWLNTLRARQNGRLFTDDIFKRILFNENVWFSITISLKFVHEGPISKIPALFQIMAWRHPGNKPLSEAMLVSLLTHQFVTRPQWVNYFDGLLKQSVDHLLNRPQWVMSIFSSQPAQLAEVGTIQCLLWLIPAWSPCWTPVEFTLSIIHYSSYGLFVKRMYLKFCLQIVSNFAQALMCS